MLDVAPNDAVAGSIVQRTNDATIKTANPIDPTDASNKRSTEATFNNGFELDGTELTITKYPTE